MKPIKYHAEIGGGFLEPTTYIDGTFIGDLLIRREKKGKDFGFIKWFVSVKTEILNLNKDSNET